MTIEQHIEELRVELKSACEVAERGQIQTELDLAETELANILAEQDGWRVIWGRPDLQGSVKGPAE